MTPPAEPDGLGLCPWCGTLAVHPTAEAVLIRPRPLSNDPARILIPLDSTFRSGLRLDRLLGMGATGAVFCALHRATARPVAVKFLFCPDSAEDRARFEMEGRILSRLRHPSIVAIFDLGVSGGFPYLVLECIDGGSLQQQLPPDKPWSLERCVELMVPCLDGLQACHDAGVVHRDLKPANVLLSRDGRPKLSDFGLIRLTGTLSGLTNQGVILGSPHSIAPEVIAGATAGAAADVYAVGVMLYRILTGRVPFEADSIQDLLTMHVTAAPIPLRRLAPGLPARVDSLVLRCLSKDPADRPPSPRSIIEELAGATAGVDPDRTDRLTARAVPPFAGQGSRPPAARKPPALALVLALLLGTGFGLVVWWARPVSSPAGPPPPEAARSPSGSSLPHEGLSLGMRGIVEPGVMALALSQDGRLLVTGGRARGTASVWDVRTGRCLARIGEVGPRLVRGIALSPAGTRVVVCFDDGRAVVESLDPPGRRSTLSIGTVPPAPDARCRGESLAAGFLPDGRAVVALCDRGAIRITLEGQRTTRLANQEPLPEPTTVQLDGRSASLAVVDGVGTLRVFELTSGRIRFTLPKVAGGRPWTWDSTACRVACCGVSAGMEGWETVEIHDLERQRPVRKWDLPFVPPTVCSSLRFVAGGGRVLIGLDCAAHRYRLEWRDVADGQRLAVLPCPETPKLISSTPDGDLVAYSDGASSPHVVSRSGARLSPPVTAQGGFQDAVTALEFSPDEGRLTAGSADGQVSIWEPTRGKLARPPVLLRFAISRLETAGDGSTALCAGPSGETARIDLRTGTSTALPRSSVAAGPERSHVVEPELLEGLSVRPHLAFRAGGSIAAALPGGVVMVRDARATGTRWSVRCRLPAPVSSLAVSPSGRLLAVGAQDGELRVLSIPGPAGGR